MAFYYYRYCSSASLLFWVNAFSEPASAPPLGNTPAPLHVGAEAQTKVGDLELESLRARGGIELGGVFKEAWPDGTVSCGWEGMKCHCVDDDSSVGNVRLTVGLSCRAGQVTDFRIVDFQISSRSKDCPVAAPAICAASLYTRN